MWDVGAWHGRHQQVGGGRRACVFLAYLDSGELAGMSYFPRPPLFLWPPPPPRPAPGIGTAPEAAACAVI